jgi:RNA polymerase sigma-70 factor (ECF subfamily)
MQPEAAVTRMDPARERALVARSREDSAAFAELYDFYLPRIYGFVARRVGDRSMAEDLTATTFERGLMAVRRGDFRNESFGGWLYRVASNAIVDQARHERRVIPLAGRAPGGDESSADTDEVGDDRALAAFGAAADREVLIRAIRRLPEGHRRLIVLKFFDGLEIDELCGALGCSRATLAVKLHRALGALRGALAQETTDAA